LKTQKIPNRQIRLNKFISDSGLCSRREADKLIVQKRVKINGILPQLGIKVKQNDTVTVDNKIIKKSPENKTDRVYIAYNKPIGIICTTEIKIKDNIISKINYPTRIFPIGRLDKPSEGLILLTSDGDIVNKILRAENNHDKEYIVTINKPITNNFIKQMTNGIPILNTITKKCQVTKIEKFIFKITLTQGLNRQIRRMCEYLGCKVTKLKRIRIMNIHLKDLKQGEWRALTSKEINQVNKSVNNT